MEPKSMEPVSVGIAQIIGLVVEFLQERREQTKATIDEYKEWLRRKEHGQVLDALERNQGLVDALADLLAEGQAEIRDRLQRIDNVLSQVVKHVQGWERIARAINCRGELSEQSLDVLRQFNARGASRLIEAGSIRSGEKEYMFADGDRKTGDNLLRVSESRFIEADLATLVDLGLLLLDYTPQRHSSRFTITRAGAELGRAESTVRSEALP